MTSKQETEMRNTMKLLLRQRVDLMTFEWNPLPCSIDEQSIKRSETCLESDQHYPPILRRQESNDEMNEYGRSSNYEEVMITSRYEDNIRLSANLIETKSRDKQIDTEERTQLTNCEILRKYKTTNDKQF